MCLWDSLSLPELTHLGVLPPGPMQLAFFTLYLSNFQLLTHLKLPKTRINFKISIFKTLPLHSIATWAKRALSFLIHKMGIIISLPQYLTHGYGSVNLSYHSYHY